MRPRKNRNKYVSREPRTRINEQIRAREVRVIGDGGENIGVMDPREALEQARAIGLDLVEVSPNANPPVAHIVDFGKYQYEQKKKKREANQKSTVTSTETKVVQIKIGTGEHDLALKAKRISEWLKEGHRVKLDLFLAGRAKYMKEDFLKERLNRVLVIVSEAYKVADGPKKSPKGLSLVLERDKSTKKKENAAPIVPTQSDEIPKEEKQGPSPSSEE
ncbi:MAG: translation initiation factor IF-3 [Parcubacteria group bacterium]|nr:translation initiation factor IF-3 [Parcubacteria group bacterium]